MNDTAPPRPQRPPTAIGVGMPKWLHLCAFGHDIFDAFGKHAYLVGSAATGKHWRDVDVRLLLPDDEFDALFPGHLEPNWVNAKWSVMCAAFSELARQRTSLPVDFQIQRQTQANELFPNRVRVALGLRLSGIHTPARTVPEQPEPWSQP